MSLRRCSAEKPAVSLCPQMDEALFVEISIRLAARPLFHVAPYLATSSTTSAAGSCAKLCTRSRAKRPSSRNLGRRVLSQIGSTAALLISAMVSRLRSQMVGRKEVKEGALYL